MARRDEMRANARMFLEPDEPIEAVIAARTKSIFTALALFVVVSIPGIGPPVWADRCRLIVVTPRRILVLDTGNWSAVKPKGVVAELPRSTPIGPPKGILWHRVQVFDTTLRVRRAFFKDVAAVTPAGRVPQ